MSILSTQTFLCFEIVTSEGESGFSDLVLIQTLSDETAMDKFKKDLSDTFIRPIIYEAEMGKNTNLVPSKNRLIQPKSRNDPPVQRLRLSTIP